MKYQEEIKQLEAEQIQVSDKIDKAIAVKKQIEENIQNLVIDYNGIQKAIIILRQMGKDKKEVKKNGNNK